MGSKTNIFYINQIDEDGLLNVLGKIDTKVKTKLNKKLNTSLRILGNSCITCRKRGVYASIGSFVSEVLNLDASLKWWLPNKNLYEAYLKWCSKNNERSLSQKGLAIRLQEKGFKRGVSNGVRFWLGVAVKVEWI